MKEAKCLDELVHRNKCTATDVVAMALLLLHKEAEGKVLIERSSSLKDTLEDLLWDKKKVTIQTYCQTVLGCEPKRLYAFLKRVEEGKNIRGFGGQNRWRDKSDDRVHKTDTARYAYCIERDTGLSLDDYFPS